MPVPKRKTSRMKRGFRRSHDALTASTLSVEKTTGEIHLRHHVSPEGVYRGRKVIDKGADVAKDKVPDQYDSKIDQGAEAAKDAVDKID